MMKTTKDLFQWDINQKLVGVEGEYVDFLIEGEVYRIASMGGECLIPDEWLQTGGTKVVWECFSDNTRKAYKINIYDRPMPPDYVYTPTQKETFDSLIARVDNAVADMYERAESGEFDGKDYVITEADYDAIAEKVEASIDVTEVLERLDEVEDELSDMEDSLSDKATKDELQLVNQKYNDLFILKQDKLTSGYTIKTINGQSVLGSGNIQIQGGSSDVDKAYVDQQDNLLGQAISNLGASTSQSISQLGQTKQDKLTSGTTIKTINGESVLGSGNIVIGGSGGDVTKAYVDEKDAELQSAIDDRALIEDNYTHGLNDYYREIFNSGFESKWVIRPPRPTFTKTAYLSRLSSGKVRCESYDDDIKSTDTELSKTLQINSYSDSGDIDKSASYTVNGLDIKQLNNEGNEVSLFNYNNTIQKPFLHMKCANENKDINLTIDDFITLQSLSTTKQDTLVSGTNIKTINNMSILGSGNINISGGGGEDYTLIHHDKMTESTSSATAFDVTFTDDYKEINFVVAVPKTTLSTLTGSLYVFDRSHVTENPTVTPDYMNITGLKNKTYAVMFSGEIITFGDNTRGLYRHVAVNTPHTGANGLCLATTRDLPNIARLRIQFNGGADADTEIWVYGRK